jgi:diaminopimelate decarboxylase
MGVDCSSLGELVLSERLGFREKDIMFTSNETPLQDYEKAYEL